MICRDSVMKLFPGQPDKKFYLGLESLPGYRKPDYKKFLERSVDLVHKVLYSLPVFSPVKLNGVAVKLSGGSDSSTAAAICKKAVESDGKSMVCITVGTDPDNQFEQYDIFTAERFCDDIGIEYVYIEGNPLYEAWNNVQPLVSDPRDYYTRIARIRDILAKQEATRRKLITVGTMNRTEELLHSYTEGLIPPSLSFIDALYKSEVMDLAKYVNIPDYIQKRDSLGSEIGITDANLFGVTHVDGLDAVLYLFEQGKTPLEINREYGIDENWLYEIYGYIKNQNWRVFSTTLVRDSILSS